LIITLYVSYQQSFDTFHAAHENVYRVNSIREEDDKLVNYSSVPPAIGPALQATFPDVEAYARLGFTTRVMLQYKEKLFRMTGFVEADSTIFDVLSFTFLQGDKRALYQPGSVVLTKSTAKQIFGDEDPINKTITSPDHADRMLTVKGIIEDYPSNSHLVINAIHSVGALMDAAWNSWEISWDGSVILYVKLAPQRDSEGIAQRALPMLKKNLIKSEDGSEEKFGIYLQPIANIYLDDPLRMEFTKKGQAQYVYIFSLLGVFLLIIACINYVNLSIADFDSRKREIGVRKVLGAGKRQIGFQVALEAVTISVISLLFAVGLLYVLFPKISEMLDSNLKFEMLLHPDVTILTLLVFILLIIISTAYPAYLLALQKPVQDLKANFSYGAGMNLGKVLLTVQCMISIICICATVIIGKQIKFIRDTDLGYDRNNVVSLVMPDEYPVERISVLKNEMSRLAGVDAVSYSYYLMPISTYFKGWYQVEKREKMEPVLVNELFVDYEYFQTMGIEVIAGRNFSIEHSSDARQAFIINETAAKAFGWTNPIGKRITVGHPGETMEVREGFVVGVVRDFNTLSLHRKIEPVILRLPWDSWPGNSLNIRVTNSLSETLPAIKTTYEKLMPGMLADIRIVGDLHERQYQNEDRAFTSLQVGTVVIILISAFGIFSLSLYMSVKRMKEFGIRKVLGAGLSRIVWLHISYFLKIVLIANLIALPLAYWLVEKWLADFAYRTNLSLLIFFSVMGISCLLVIVSGGYSALKAGSLNPVDVIKAQQ
jgi:putative ABC transport system permease protein